MSDNLRPNGGYLYSADTEAIKETHKAHPSLAMSPYYWCPKCHYHARTYNIGHDILRCEHCGYAPPSTANAEFYEWIGAKPNKINPLRA